MCDEVPPDVAVVAVGGYGRWEQTPGSDIDLMFVHRQGQPSDLSGLVDGVLYPLWDSGLPVGHSVRTVAECRAEASARVESLTTLLDARLIAGSDELLHDARLAAMEVLHGDGGAFVDSLRGSRAERERKFGSAGRMLEPDLKEGLGGLRDLQMLRWMARLAGPDDVPIEEALSPSLIEALDFLLLVRTALHRASSTRSNRLGAEHHQAVATALGIEDQAGWEARDGLMRSLFRHARGIDFVTERALGSAGPQMHPATEKAQDLVQLIKEPDASFILRARDADGTIEHLLPEWEGVRGRPQRDPYHRFPADVHLLETFTEAVRLFEELDEPFAVEAASSIDDTTALYLGALLHDIGKVGRGSHVRIGAEVTERVLARLRVEDEVRRDVLFLVAEHLLLSDTATRRNLEEEDLILHVAARVGDERRLALLYLLTVADAHATGPVASSPWRLGLIRELVAKVSHAFQRGLMDRDQAGRLASAERDVRSALMAEGAAEADADEFVGTMPPAYISSVRSADAIRDRALVAPRPQQSEIRWAFRGGDIPGTFRVAIGAVDRLGLLAAVAGSMTLSGLTILGAQAFTTEDGLALDVFEVRGAFEEDVNAERWDRFHSLVTGVVRDEVDLSDRVRELRAHYARGSTGVDVTVRIDQDVSDFYTVVEVGGPDRLGLLFELASAISRLNLDVHVAKVATYGHRVVDVFYVRDPGGEKVEDPSRVAELERSLVTAATEH